ncbi:dihydrodipicolinate synthase family protein [Planktomarina temperata]|jgi:4-hydroxy-tetrahydrodipicolinate synthase|uniref:Dihydrodipicolinate synthase DapA n=1 Tax=Planktomarina temperata RCA23 TaxID=666509 RepID=A0AAN0VJ63_9RHOB|nr:dihydrodipicolinate synthase DapA [Planktomarina temperata RCA23]|tara:strand:- start:9 stop:911 length:903 start_codon:yes stop_codon:yes gene_type:complete
MTKQLHPGIYPMLYSFFGSDGELRLDPFSLQVDAAISAGAKGIAVLGLGTEAAKLDEDECAAVITTIAKRLNNQLPMIVTIRGETPDNQLKAARRALDLGATALLLQPPSETISEAALLTFFSEVINALDCPVGIQNAPEFLGYGLNDNNLISLAQNYTNFSIAKLECSALALEPSAKALTGKTMVFNGRCGLELTDNLRAGAQGLIPGIETIDRTAAIHAAFIAGEHEYADELYAKLLPVLTFVMQGIPQFLTYGKTLLAYRLGIEIGSAREPWLQPTDFGLECITRYAAQLGPLPTGA